MSNGNNINLDEIAEKTLVNHNERMPVPVIKAKNSDSFQVTKIFIIDRDASNFDEDSEYSRTAPLEGVQLEEDTPNVTSVDGETPDEPLQKRIQKAEGKKLDLSRLNEIDDYYMMYDHFIINRIQHKSNEKIQLVETFDESFLYSFGTQGEFAQFNGTLINSKNHDWRDHWLYIYDKLLNSTESGLANIDVYINFENVLWKGEIISTNWNEKSNNPTTVPFGFRFYLKDKIFMKDNVPPHDRHNATHNIASKDSGKPVLNKVNDFKRKPDSRTPIEFDEGEYDAQEELENAPEPEDPEEDEDSLGEETTTEANLIQLMKEYADDPTDENCNELKDEAEEASEQEVLNAAQRVIFEPMKRLHQEMRAALNKENQQTLIKNLRLIGNLYKNSWARAARSKYNIDVNGETQTFDNRDQVSLGYKISGVFNESLASAKRSDYAYGPIRYQQKDLDNRGRGSSTSTERDSNTEEMRKNIRRLNGKANTTMAYNPETAQQGSTRELDIISILVMLEQGWGKQGKNIFGEDAPAIKYSSIVNSAWEQGSVKTQIESTEPYRLSEGGDMLHQSNNGKIKSHAVPDGMNYNNKPEVNAIGQVTNYGGTSIVEFLDNQASSLEISPDKQAIESAVFANIYGGKEQTGLKIDEENNDQLTNRDPLKLYYLITDDAAEQLRTARDHNLKDFDKRLNMFTTDGDTDNCTTSKFPSKSELADSTNANPFTSLLDLYSVPRS